MAPGSTVQGRSALSFTDAVKEHERVPPLERGGAGPAGQPYPALGGRGQLCLPTLAHEGLPKMIGFLLALSFLADEIHVGLHQ